MKNRISLAITAILVAASIAACGGGSQTISMSSLQTSVTRAVDKQAVQEGIPVRVANVFCFLVSKRQAVCHVRGTDGSLANLKIDINQAGTEWLVVSKS